MTRDVFRQVVRRPRFGALILLLWFVTSVIAFVSDAVWDAGWARPYEYGARVFQVVVRSGEKGLDHDQIPNADLAAWTSAPHPSFVVAGYDLVAGDLTVGSVHSPVFGFRVSPTLFQVTGLSPIAGRGFSVGLHAGTPREAVLSEGYWRSVLHGDPTIVGQVVDFHGELVTIVGVAPAALLLPLTPRDGAIFVASEAGQIIDPRNGKARVICRVTGSLPIAEAQSELTRTVQPDSGTAAQQIAGLRPVADYAGARLPGGSVFALLLATILGLGFSAIAHLVSTECSARSVELSIRSTLGATYTRLVAQLCCEFAAPIVVAGLGALWLSTGVLHWLGDDLSRALLLPRTPRVSGAVMQDVTIGILAMFAVTAIFPGLAVRRIAIRGAQTLRMAIGQVRPRIRLERWLIGTQAFLASVVVLVAIAAGSVFVRLLNVDIGLDLSHVLQTSIGFPKNGPGPKSPAEAKQLFAAIESNVRGISGVEAVSMVDLLPFLASPSRENVRREGGVVSQVSIRRVDPGYFAVLHLRQVQGRLLEEADMSSPPSVSVVSAGMARQLWRDDWVLGRVITVGGHDVRVVGVVNDVTDARVGSPPVQTVYLPYSDQGYRRYSAARGILIRVKPDEELFVSRAIDERLATSGIAPPEPVAPLSLAIRQTLLAPRVYGLSSLLFGLVAILLAGGGTYSVLSQIARRKNREIAIRAAFGASTWDLVRYLIRYCVSPGLLGIACGTLAGFYVAKSFVASALREMQLSPATALLSAAVLLAVLSVSVVDPLVRACRHSAAELLRNG